jgi:hypothetical protein
MMSREMSREVRGADREKNDEGYSPTNCRWATLSEQRRNYRRNHLLTFQDETKPVIAWAEETGLSYRTIMTRLKAGWTTERTLTTPADPKYRRKHVAG